MDEVINDARKLAVFDFDHTLIEGESLWQFMIYVAGAPRAFSEGGP